MKGSGKQILLRVLRELSTTRISDVDLERATDRIRSALLWHGSSSDDYFNYTQALQWANAKDDDGDVQCQGLAIQNGQVLLSDFLDTMLETPGMEEFMMKRYQGLSHNDYLAACWALWCLVSAQQMYVRLLEVEAPNDAELELEKWLENMSEKQRHFLRSKQKPS